MRLPQTRTAQINTTFNRFWYKNDTLSHKQLSQSHPGIFKKYTICWLIIALWYYENMLGWLIWSEVRFNPTGLIRDLCCKALFSWTQAVYCMAFWASKATYIWSWLVRHCKTVITVKKTTKYFNAPGCGESKYRTNHVERASRSPASHWSGNCKNVAMILAGNCNVLQFEKVFIQKHTTILSIGYFPSHKVICQCDFLPE